MYELPNIVVGTIIDARKGYEKAGQTSSPLTTRVDGPVSCSCLRHVAGGSGVHVAVAAAGPRKAKDDRATAEYKRVIAVNVVGGPVQMKNCDTPDATRNVCASSRKTPVE